MSAQPSLFDAPALDLFALCNPEEIAVANQLRTGRARALKVETIAAEASLALGRKISGRRVQTILLHLIEAHRVPVGTSMREPFGNYLIDDAEDLRQTVELLKVRGIDNLVRAAALRKITLARLLAEVQMELEADAA